MNKNQKRSTILKEGTIGSRALDLSGMRFGKLSVIEPDREVGGKCGLYWKCQCECGERLSLRSDSIRHNKFQDCGCVNKIELVGKTFGKLTVIQVVRIGQRKIRFWKCRCSCGKEMKRSLSSRELILGEVKSCGCMHNQMGSASPAFKGYKDIYLSDWNSWKSGASCRGIPFHITIEYAWELFEKQNKKCALSGLPIHLGKQTRKNGVRKTASIDRIESSKGYEEGNVQWVHKYINMMKRNIPENQFIELCKFVANNCASPSNDLPVSDFPVTSMNPHRISMEDTIYP